MPKFIALYRLPVAGLEAWSKVDEATRKEEEAKLQAKWNAWAEANKGAILDTAAAGKNQHVEGSGVTNTPNDIMMYSLVEADSAEAAAKLFVGHPHLEIPDATIDVMPSVSLSDMR